MRHRWAGRYIVYVSDFPTFGWGLSLRLSVLCNLFVATAFPHLRVGTFIEASAGRRLRAPGEDFPTFGWGLSLRQSRRYWSVFANSRFPHLRVGTFIEAKTQAANSWPQGGFPHLRVGTFIEARAPRPSQPNRQTHFPTFGWGLSLRRRYQYHHGRFGYGISPPSGGDFH